MLPPYPNATLPRIYPWDEYNQTLVMNWLFAQAKKTGFPGDFNDFKLRYGAYIETCDPQEVQTLIEQYTGPYHITPLASIDQVLRTKNKVLNQDIIVEQIPPSVNKPIYSGRYEVTPLAFVDQVLRTKGTILEDNVIIEKIPYAETSNEAGGCTVTIG